MHRLVPYVVVGGLLIGLLVAGEEPYDFRASQAWRDLDANQHKRVETVHRDLLLLWGALDRYADAHHGQPPQALIDLVPAYLTELPVDPFATGEEGGYRYETGAPGNRAWVIASVGLPEFPYQSAGNRGLHLTKGVWLSGFNLATETEVRFAGEKVGSVDGAGELSLAPGVVLVETIDVDGLEAKAIKRLIQEQHQEVARLQAERSVLDAECAQLREQIKAMGHARQARQDAAGADDLGERILAATRKLLGAYLRGSKRLSDEIAYHEAQVVLLRKGLRGAED